MAKKPKPLRWNVYRTSPKAIWLGTVEAPDKSAAVEKAAQKFETEAWRLYALPR